MSALAIPAPLHADRATRRRRHLQLVGPGFVPAPAPVGRPTAPAPRPGPAARPATAPIRLTARGRLVVSTLTLLVSVALAVAAGAWLGGVVSEQPYAGPVDRVSVTAGDTVWGIAAATAAEGQDVRDVVDDILWLNGLAGGELVVGQQLVVPAG